MAPALEESDLNSSFMIVCALARSRERASQRAKQPKEALLSLSPKLRLLTVAAAMLASTASVANAQDFGGDATPDLNVQRFVPVTGPYGIFTTESAQSASHLQVSGGLLLNFAKDPLVFEEADGDIVPIVEDQLAADVLFALGLFDVLEIDLALPVYFVNSANLGSGNAIDGATVGDLRARLKYSLLNPSDSPVGFGLTLGTTLPTGDAEAFTSSGNLGVQPGIVVDTKAGPVLLALNLGANIQGERGFGNLNVSNELLYNAGAEVGVIPDTLFLGAEVNGSTAMDDFFADEKSPLEALLGLKLRTPVGINFVLGGGGGLVAGYGAPAYRVFGGINYANYDNDWDDDGLLNDADQCPRDPEDLDQFEDENGCPDPDNDQDGILDGQDECPTDPEDKDEFEDVDGCPDPDNDKDGIADTSDKCPNVAGVKEFEGCPTPDKDGDGIIDNVDKCPTDPEDKDGFEDVDGCPDPDNDKDGILDTNDKCPNNAEDKDAFEDEDGCPDPDNDKDGVPDAQDKCPDKQETINGVQDEDGCPDKGESLVEFTAEEIKILQQVFFDTNKDTIKPQSFNLLNQVAQILKAHPEVKKIEIQGHTDDVGEDKANDILSNGRANSVRKYLIEKGVDGARLTPKGYGESKPKVDIKGLTGGKLKAARAENRRVQFIILEQEGVNVKTQ